MPSAESPNPELPADYIPVDPQAVVQSLARQLADKCLDVAKLEALVSNLQTANAELVDRVAALTPPAEEQEKPDADRPEDDHSGNNGSAKGRQRAGSGASRDGGPAPG